jgi:hypothetical protein
MTAETTLSEYELQRLEKIKRNEKRLAELGLDTAKQNLKRSASYKTPTRKKKKTTAAANVNSEPQRSSRRLKRQPVLYEPLMDDDLIRKIDSSNSKEKKIERTSTSKFRCEIPMDLKSSPLSEKEKDLITKKMEEDFLGKFEVGRRWHSETHCVYGQNNKWCYFLPSFSHLLPIFFSIT